MRNAGGYGVSFTCDGGKDEHDTFTCYHCNTVVVVKVKCDPNDLGGMCRLCNKMICPTCVKEGACVPFEKKLEQMEARYHARRSYGM